MGRQQITVNTEEGVEPKENIPLGDPKVDLVKTDGKPLLQGIDMMENHGKALGAIESENMETALGPVKNWGRP